MTAVLTAISDNADVELTSSSLDAIKHGLIGTSDEKNNWFDHTIGDVSVRIAADNDDSDIVHFRVNGLDDRLIDRLSNIGTKE